MISRIAWGGPVSPFGKRMIGPATSVTAHHPYPHKALLGALASAEVKEVLAIHDFHASKWLGIGYNFVISQNGHTYEGRGWGRVGAHAGTTEGNNTSYGIAFLLDGYKEAPSTLARLAFKELRSEGVRLGFLTLNHTLKLHRDWHATDCPGKVCADALLAAESPRGRLLRLGMQGEDVRELQRLLGMELHHHTGFYGVNTAKAVSTFQRDNGLAVDGIAGPATMKKLRA